MDGVFARYFSWDLRVAALWKYRITSSVLRPNCMTIDGRGGLEGGVEAHHRVRGRGRICVQVHA